MFRPCSKAIVSRPTALSTTAEGPFEVGHIKACVSQPPVVSTNSSELNISKDLDRNKAERFNCSTPTQTATAKAMHRQTRSEKTPALVAKRTRSISGTMTSEDDAPAVKRLYLAEQDFVTELPFECSTKASDAEQKLLEEFREDLREESRDLDARIKGKSLAQPGPVSCSGSGPDGCSGCEYVYSGPLEIFSFVCSSCLRVEHRKDISSTPPTINNF
jgi:hypothetical protein